LAALRASSELLDLNPQHSLMVQGDLDTYTSPFAQWKRFELGRSTVDEHLIDRRHG